MNSYRTHFRNLSEDDDTNDDDDSHEDDDVGGEDNDHEVGMLDCGTYAKALEVRRNCLLKMVS